MPQTLMLLIAGALAYPLFWAGRAALYSEAELFGLPELGLLAMALVLMRMFFAAPEKKTDGVAGSDSGDGATPGDAGRGEGKTLRLILLLSAILLTVTARDWDFVFYVGLVWFGCSYKKELEKLLPLFIVALSAVNMAIMVVEYVTFRPPYGLCGNWNWSMTLLFAGCFAAPECFDPARRRSLRTIFFFFGVFLWFYLGRGGFSSRGAMLAALAAAVFLTIASAKTLSKRWKNALAVALGAAGGAGMAYWIWHTPGELRQHLFAAGWEGGLDHWFSGAGVRHVSEALTPHFAEAYFLSPFAADHHPHPHNEILYFFDAFGVAGLLFFAGIALTLYLAWRDWDQRRDALLPPALLLFFYGMGDAGLAAWPLDVVFYLSVGTLMPFSFSAKRVFAAGKKPYKALGGALIAIMLSAVALGCCRNFRSGLLLRAGRLSGKNGGTKEVLAERKRLLDASLAVKFTPKAAYLASQSELFDFKNPAGAEKYFALLSGRGYDDYLHLNLLRARAAAASGDMEKAEKFFAAERKNYPLGINALYYQELALMHRNRPDEAAAVRETRLEIMKKRGIAPEKLPLLLKYPDWDITNDERLFE